MHPSLQRAHEILERAAALEPERRVEREAREARLADPSYREWQLPEEGRRNDDDCDDPVLSGDRVLRRGGEEPLVYKRYDPPEPQQVTDLDPVSQARWDAWLDRRVADKLAEFAEVIGDASGEGTAQFVSEYFHKKIAPLKEEIAPLRAEIAALRDRVLRLEATNEVLRGFITSGNRAATLTSIKGGADAA